MIHLTFFSQAHAIAKQTRQFYPTYRGAFSVALRGLYAELRVKRMAEKQRLAARSFREMPLQGAKLLGFVSFKNCDIVRGLWTNERNFYIEGDQYDFECDAMPKMAAFIERETNGLTLAKVAKPVQATEPVKETKKQKAIESGTLQTKRAASGRGLMGGRRVAKARFWGEQVAQSSKNEMSVYH